MIICATSSNLDELIEKKDTERGRLLSRWIGLIPIEEKDKIAREKFNSDVRAAKIIEETKRALYCGATTTTYLQGLSYGVPEIANVACVSDLQGLVFNPKGDRDQTDVHDGSGWVSPY